MNQWNDRRIGRLGYLVGIGWSASRIAADPVVAAPADEVRRQVERLGLQFRTAVTCTPLNLKGQHMAFFDAEARRRRVPTEALLRQTCERIADDRRQDLLVPESI